MKLDRHGLFMRRLGWYCLEDALRILKLSTVARRIDPSYQDRPVYWHGAMHNVGVWHPELPPMRESVAKIYPELDVDPPRAIVMIYDVEALLRDNDGRMHPEDFEDIQDNGAVVELPDISALKARAYAERNDAPKHRPPPPPAATASPNVRSSL